MMTKLTGTVNFGLLLLFVLHTSVCKLFSQ